MIIDEIHLLGVERGAVIEAIITRQALVGSKIDLCIALAILIVLFLI